MRDQRKDKQAVLKYLTELPIITVASDRAGVPRGTVYRWMDEDPEFDTACSEAMRLGRERVNDTAYGKLLGLINKEHFGATKYYLDRHHPEFKMEPSTAASVNTNPISRRFNTSAKPDESSLSTVDLSTLPKKLRKNVVRRALQNREVLTGMNEHMNLSSGSRIEMPRLSRTDFLNALNDILRGVPRLISPLEPKVPPTQSEETARGKVHS